MSDDQTDIKTPAPTPIAPAIRPISGYGLPPGPEKPATAHEGALDVAQIRAKTGLSQAAFAARYGFSKRTLQEWEQHRKRPTGAARSLLLVIRRHPKKVARALQSDAEPTVATLKQKPESDASATDRK